MEGLGIGAPNWITRNFMRYDSDGRTVGGLPTINARLRNSGDRGVALSPHTTTYNRTYMHSMRKSFIK